MFKPQRGGGSGGWKGGKDFGRKKSWGQSFDNRGERPEMHRATCAECGESCEVPFRPTGSRPVFCDNCFKRNGGGGESRRPMFDDKPSYSKPFRGNDSSQGSGDQYKEQFKALNAKLDLILKAISPIKISATEQAEEEVIEKEPTTKKKSIKDKTVEKKKKSKKV